MGIVSLLSLKIKSQIKEVAAAESDDVVLCFSCDSTAE